MVEQKLCSFCGANIEPGTGKMYVKKDGTVYMFCTNKCKKNMIELGRVPRTTEWTRAYAQTKMYAKAEKHVEPKAAEEKPAEETVKADKPKSAKKKPAAAKKAKAEKPAEETKA
ncbi:MAG: 50S ribosomal protein L24e [Methanomassiliicoccales archaeon]|jgi:large subunit ribosomal protein L24e